MAKLARVLITFGSQLRPKRMRSVSLIQASRTSPPPRHGGLEADADPATTAEQGEVSVRKIVDFLQKLRHELRNKWLVDACNKAGVIDEFHAASGTNCVFAPSLKMT
jgi:hypothetical protein